MVALTAWRFSGVCHAVPRFRIRTAAEIGQSAVDSTQPIRCTNGLHVSALRLALRSYRDLYDRIWIMLLVSAAWWVLLITVIFAPPATLLLFKHADPRIGPWQDRPGLRESGEFLWAQFIRSWIVTLATLLIVALTAFNLDYYGSGGSALSFLSPLWLVLLLLTVTATLVILALAAMTDLPEKQVIVTGARVPGAR